MKKSSILAYLLLDADIIIDLHQLGLWDWFINQNKIYVASIVIEEVIYYENRERQRIYIDLKAQCAVGKITEVSARSKLIGDTIYKLRKHSLAPELDPGELESITVLYKRKKEGILFCTADGSAIRALAMLNLLRKAISLEEALDKSGLNMKNLAIKPKHSMLRFSKLVDKARDEMAQADYLDKQKAKNKKKQKKK